ncbi:MAG: c-type cytochrome [Thermodesulfobacteriota bacterium]
MKKFMLIILSLTLMLVAGSYGTASADLQNGERIFKKYCAKCHAKDGTVSEYGRHIKPHPARNLTTNRLFIAPTELRVIIKYGVYGREMKSWQNVLSDKGIVDVASYVRTFTYKPDLAAGKAFFQKRCSSCHDPKGSGKKIFHAPDLDMSSLGPVGMARVVRFGRHGTMMSVKTDLFKNTDLADVIGYLQSIKK